MKFINKLILMSILIMILFIGSSFDGFEKDENISLNDTSIARTIDNTVTSENYNIAFSYINFIKEYKRKEERKIEQKNKTVSIVINAAGDCTLGSDDNFGYINTFHHEVERQNYEYDYFFRNVKDIFEDDDLTIVNLETTLTTSTEKADKLFKFRGHPSYVQILKEGDIEVVNIANNHIFDYLQQGYNDTLKTLEDADIGYFGYENQYITEIKGIKIGLLGCLGWRCSESIKEQLKQDIDKLKEVTDIIILSFHWGVERAFYPIDIQRELAHYCIDQGVDLILGHHPHVIQGIEKYNGKNIVYSLGNFSFGGNKNPSDKDTFIYRHTFHFIDGQLKVEETEVIPCSISSVTDRNNYQPTILKGEDAERVFSRIIEYSAGFERD